MIAAAKTSRANHSASHQTLPLRPLPPGKEPAPPSPTANCPSHTPGHHSAAKLSSRIFSDQDPATNAVNREADVTGSGQFPGANGYGSNRDDHYLLDEVSASNVAASRHPPQNILQIWEISVEAENRKRRAFGKLTTDHGQWVLDLRTWFLAVVCRQGMVRQ